MTQRDRSKFEGALRKGSLVKFSENSTFLAHVEGGVPASKLDLLGLIVELSEGKALVYSQNAVLHEFPTYLLDEI